MDNEGILRVVVLGCGPSGLMSAHAAALAGCDVRILSKPRKSRMNGAQYLHRPIPLASAAKPFKIDYRLWGSAEGYRDKVYGRDSGVQVSPESLVGIADAWDIREAYDWLWETYGSYVREWEATPISLQGMIAGWNPDLVISTVPAPLICKGDHGFTSVKIWASDKSMMGAGDDVVLCNGDKNTGWYRASRIQGYENTEWPHDRRPPFSSDRLWEVEKPIEHKCDCFPGVVRMGRYGSWTKGVLSHESFYGVQDLLKGVVDD